MNPPDLARCVRDAQQADPSARTLLARHWASLALAWCTRLGGPWVDPEEAAQDADCA